MNSSLLGTSPLAAIAALVVARDAADREFLASILTSAGLTVTTADSFSSARALLTARPPAVLVTELRLGAHNGLHLALLGRSMKPHMAVIVTAGLNDRVMRRDAVALGAAFLLGPVTTGALLAAVYRTALREPNADGSVDAATSLFGDRFGASLQAAFARLDEPERRYSKRRRDIATFLFLEASRR